MTATTSSRTRVLVAIRTSCDWHWDCDLVSGNSQDCHMRGQQTHTRLEGYANLSSSKPNRKHI